MGRYSQIGKREAMAAHNGNEVEIKFVIHDLDGLLRSIQAAGLQQKTPSTFRATPSTTTPPAICAEPERCCASGSMATAAR